MAPEQRQALVKKLDTGRQLPYMREKAAALDWEKLSDGLKSKLSEVMGRQSDVSSEPEKQNWRTAYDATNDEFRKKDILHAIAWNESTPQEMADALARVTDDTPDGANILWAVAKNKASTDEVKNEALRRRDE